MRTRSIYENQELYHQIYYILRNRGNPSQYQFEEGFALYGLNFPKNRPSLSLNPDYVEMLSVLHRLIEELPERQREIMRGIIQGKTEERLGKGYGITRAAISDIKRKLHLKLRRRLNKEGFDHLPPKEK